MHPGQASPAEHEQASRHHEHDEGEVNDRQGVGEEQHPTSLLRVVRVSSVVMTPTTAATPSQLMGAVVKRKEDARLITGTALYVTDVAVPGMCHVAFVRSPHAHARIRGIDGTAALRRPGVRLVLTGVDMKKHSQPLPPLASTGEGGGDGGASAG